MIVKIQRAIWPPDNAALVYDKKRKFFQRMRLTPDIDKALGSELKGYFEVKFEKQGYEHVMLLVRKVEGLNW